MVEYSIDEFTLVMQLNDDLKRRIDAFSWEYSAKKLIRIFEKHSMFESVLGGQRTEERPPQGYNKALTYGEHSFYIAVAYHDYQKDMGVCVKFSAQALDYYLEVSGFTVYGFLQSIQDAFYTTRLSRVDMVADFIDEEVDSTFIYQGFIDNRIGVFREHINKNTGEVEFRRIKMNYQGLIKGADVPTIYIGSVQSPSRLRIYDKRLEQIERNGTKLEKALNSSSWCRWEGVFRNHYAHQISDSLLRIQTDQEYGDLIASTLLQKFRLMYIDKGVVDCEIECVQIIMDSIMNQSFSLRSPSNRNYDIWKSIHHLFIGSGVISTLYKVKSIWGVEALEELLIIVKEYTEEWTPNADCRYWLGKNESDYKRSNPNFKDYIEKCMSQLP